MLNDQTVALRRRRRLIRSLHTAGDVFMLCFSLLIILGPILWMVQMSLRTANTLFLLPPPLREGWTLENYQGLLTGNFQGALFNSFKVAGATTVFALLVGVPAAYSLSRARFKREKAIAFWILATRMALPIVFALPLFVIFQRLRLTNTHQGLVIVYMTFLLPMVIWTMRPFFDGVPRDLEESAWVDGATPLQNFTKVVLPLTTPGLAAVSVLCFIMGWIEFFFALVFTRGPNATAPVAIVNFMGYAGWEWGKITAAGTAIMLPVIVFSVLTQRYLVRGLLGGAMKG